MRAWLSAFIRHHSSAVWVGLGLTLGIKGSDMPSVTFVLDESGAKGYSDNREKCKGELGVVAGVLIPTEYLRQVTAEIEQIIANYKADGKFHITDLSTSRQGSLRSEIFAYLASVNACWVYEAMYVEGLYSHAQFVSSLRDKAKESRRSSVKLSGNEKKELLHSQLLLGAFGKAVAFCLDCVGNEVRLNVLTDQLDAPIVKEFKEDAKRLFNVGEKREHKVTGFDVVAQKVATGSISSEITEGINYLGDLSGVAFEISISDSPLTIIADILANSVNHHLSSLQTHSPGSQLNSLEAIAGHPLASLVYGVTGQESEVPQVADTIFRYPGN
ncbi:MAG: hypothetical protein MZV65_08385 [Chromatiales bacterium]|nr:hypothetical protein [Chromatiales bacterium]